MKAADLTDITIQEPKAQIVIELGNGQFVSTANYYVDTNKSGGPIIVIQAKRKSFY